MRTLFLLLLLVIPPALAFSLSTWLVDGAPPVPAVGVTDGRLQRCPPGVECLSSQAETDGIPPLAFDGDADAAMGRMLAFLHAQGDTEYVEVLGDYVHATFIRTFPSVVEDVELLLDRDEGVFQIRAFERTESSASTVLARVESLEALWTVAEAGQQPERESDGS